MELKNMNVIESNIMAKVSMGNETIEEHVRFILDICDSDPAQIASILCISETEAQNLLGYVEKERILDTCDICDRSMVYCVCDTESRDSWS